MQEFIQNETSKMFVKGLKRYCQKYNKEYDQVFLLLYLKLFDEVGYMIFVDGQMQEEISLKEFLGVKVVDLKGYTVLAPPYILGFLQEFSRELDSIRIDVNVYLNEDMDDVNLFLYKEGKIVREIFLQDLIKIKNET